MRGTAGLSKVFCYSPELGECSLALGSRRLHRAIEAVLDVIVDQGPSWHCRSRFRPLGELATRPALLDHGDDLVQVFARPLEALDNAGMCSVSHGV
jgi:hypothetical protein